MGERGGKNGSRLQEVNGEKKTYLMLSTTKMKKITEDKKSVT